MSRSTLLAALATALVASPALAQSSDAPAEGAPIPVDLEDPIGRAYAPVRIDDHEPGPDIDVDWVEPAEMPIAPALRRPPPPPAPSPSGELVINGGFESPALAPGSWDVFGRVPGWMRSSGPGIEIQHGVAGAPFAGNQHVELDSHGASSMFQWLKTQPGATYLVTYRVSPRPGIAAEDNALEVSWDGDVIDRYVSDRVVGETEWELRAMLVTASSNATRLELADVSDDDSLGAYIDDVSVKLVGRAPAPAPVYRPQHWPSHWRGFARPPLAGE